MNDAGFFLEGLLVQGVGKPIPLKLYTRNISRSFYGRRVTFNHVLFCFNLKRLYNMRDVTRFL